MRKGQRRCRSVRDKGKPAGKPLGTGKENALELSKPLVDMGVVSMEELKDYIEACNKDADERKLPMGAKVVY